MIYELSALRPPFLGDSFAALKRSVVVGRYPSLPPVFSEALTTVITLMLRVSPTQRPTAAQLLSHPEIVKKVSQLNIGGQEPMERGNIMNTIKVPMALKRLNEALPKACYPSQLSARDNHGHDLAAVSENEPVTSRSNGAPPLPPTRRPLAPITNIRKQQDGTEGFVKESVREPSSRKLCDPPNSVAPRPPLAPLMEKEVVSRAEPTEPAPKVRFNRRLW